MADFAIQFLESVIPTSTLTVNVDAPPLMALQDFNKVFMIPAAYPQITAGVGRATGGAATDTLKNVMTTVQLTDIDSIHFDDGSTDAFDNLVGAHVVEYTGPVGGANEVIVRAVKVFSGSAGSFDSSAIAGISSIGDCVPFAFMRGDLNSGAWTAHSAQVEVVNDGTNNVVRVTKSNTTDTLNLVVYVVEFVGSNWTVQKVSHTFTAGNTDEDDTISSVSNVNNAFVYSTPFFGGNRPDHCLYYAYLSSTTNLRQRVHVLTGGTKIVSYVISNPQMTVQHVGAAPDGTADLNATGSSPETRDITVSSVSDFTKMIVLGFAGSDHNATTNRPSACTLFNMTSATNLRLRRSNSTGNTEYRIQIIDLTAMQSAGVDTVSTVVDTQTFLITGNFASVTSVKINGVTQTIDTSNSTTIQCTAVLGANRYGVEYDMTVIDGSVTIVVPGIPIGAPSSRGYVNLAPPLANPTNRITTTPDLSGFEQVEWHTVVGGAASEVIVYSDAAFSVSPGISQFSVRVHDGVEWGSSAVQTFTAPIPPKTKALSCPVPSL